MRLQCPPSCDLSGKSGTHLSPSPQLPSIFHRPPHFSSMSFAHKLQQPHRSWVIPTEKYHRNKSHVYDKKSYLNAAGNRIILFDVPLHPTGSVHCDWLQVKPFESMISARNTKTSIKNVTFILINQSFEFSKSLTPFNVLNS